MPEPAGTGWWLLCHLEAFEEDPQVLAICHLPSACASVSPCITTCGTNCPSRSCLPSVFLGAGTPLGLVRAWGSTLPRGDKLMIGAEFSLGSHREVGSDTLVPAAPCLGIPPCHILVLSLHEVQRTVARQRMLSLDATQWATHPGNSRWSPICQQHGGGRSQ